MPDEDPLNLRQDAGAATEKWSEMGFQIPGPTKGKVDHLIATHGAERLPRPPHAFHDIPEDRALICVVDTKMYETASFCFSAAEMALVNDSSDFRPRTWLVMDRGKAEELSKYRTAPAECRKEPRASGRK
jgi:hypothetical protein